MSFSDVFRSRRVLVTGHTGFKGSWLSLWLQELGAEVLGYALPPDPGGLFERAHVASGMRHVEGDVRAFDTLSGTFASFRPEIVLHLAAQALVRRSYTEPRETFETNVIGTVNVLEAARRTDSVNAIVVVTSDKCYENREWVWGYRENDPMGGHDPYSASKGAAELAVAAYQRSFFGSSSGVGLASARAGNVIGGGDFAKDRIIPDAVRAVLDGRPLDVRSPQAMRPWQHVLDPLSGYLALAARLVEAPAQFTGAWNFGPAHDEVLRVGPLVSRFFEELGQGSLRDVSEQHRGAPHEAGLLWLACDKASILLDWHPVLRVADTVARTAHWYRDVLLGGGDAKRACESDRAYFLEQATATEAWWTR